MDIITARSLEALRPRAGEWNDLAFQAEQQLPKLAYAWVEPYLEHRVGEGESWFCVFAYEGEELAGVEGVSDVDHGNLQPFHDTEDFPPLAPNLADPARVSRIGRKIHEVKAAPPISRRLHRQLDDPRAMWFSPASHYTPAAYRLVAETIAEAIFSRNQIQ